VASQSQSTPWPHRNGMLAIREILGFTKSNDFSIVVNYRTPRQEQWISIWKQLTRTHPIPYRECRCKEDTCKHLGIFRFSSQSAGFGSSISIESMDGRIDRHGWSRGGRTICCPCHCLRGAESAMCGWVVSRGLEQILQNKKKETLMCRKNDLRKWNGACANDGT
jgi:hypothetical protein